MLKIKMVRSKKKLKLDIYQICVTIIEAKHLEPNTNPMVVVRVGHRKKKTAVRKKSDNPYYNEYFVFDLTCTMDDLLKTKLELAVYLCGRLKPSKFHGSLVTELATVWDQPDHQYYHKWAMLTNPRDTMAASKGYIKCNIAVHAKGQKFKVPPETEGEEDIEGNLLLPIGDASIFTMRLRAQYVFTIHRAEDLLFSKRLFSRKCRVRISFVGMKKTVTGEGLSNPIFNQRIVFTEMFPPLSHRVRISFKGKSRFSYYVMNLRKISNSGKYGFLPTIGPSFIHLYSKKEDPSPLIYRGRLLLSMKTILENYETGRRNGVNVEYAAPINEERLWSINEYLLVGILYDVCMIDRSLVSRGKSISFELSIGNAGNTKYSTQFSDSSDTTSEEKSSSDDDTSEDDKSAVGIRIGRASVDSVNITEPQKVQSLDKYYNYVSFGNKKPCLYVKSQWPNTEWRMKNNNRLTYIVNYLV